MIRTLRTGFGISLSVMALCTVCGCGSSKPEPAKAPVQQAEKKTDSEPSQPDAAKPAEKVEGTAKSETPPATDSAKPEAKNSNEPKPTKLSPDLLASDKIIPLNKQGTILADTANKRILLKTTVALTNGPLEMLLCRKQTKEHESILTFDGEAYMIHATLVAWGHEKGTPAKYDPETEKFRTATGPKIGVFVNWTDENGKTQRKPAQFWIRRSIQRYFGDKMEKLPDDLTLPEDFNLRYDPINKYMHWFGPMTDTQRDELLAMSKDEGYQKLIKTIHDQSQPRQMEADWVFVGSFESDEGEGKRYQAEGGYVICVANFPMALLDLSTESSSVGNENLVYEAWTERLPPRYSEVLVELIPEKAESKVSKPEDKAAPEKDAKPEAKDSTQPKDKDSAESK